MRGVFIQGYDSQVGSLIVCMQRRSLDFLDAPHLP